MALFVMRLYLFNEETVTAVCVLLSDNQWRGCHVLQRTLCIGKIIPASKLKQVCKY